MTDFETICLLVAIAVGSWGFGSVVHGYIEGSADASMDAKKRNSYRGLTAYAYGVGYRNRSKQVRNKNIERNRARFDNKKDEG